MIGCVIRPAMRRCIVVAIVLSLLGAASHATAAGSQPARSSVKIFLVALGNGTVKPGTIGCGDTLVPVTLPVARTPAPLAAALRLLLANHQRYYGQSGLYNALYLARLTFRRAVVKHGHAAIYLGGQLRSNGVCDAPRIQGQLRRTATQFPTVLSVSVFVNGIPLKRLLSGR